MRLDKKSAVWWISILCIAVYIFEFIFLMINPDFIKYFALQADNFLNGRYPWTILTHMFSHGGFFHLLVNMLALISLGGLCEQLIGRRRFFAFYILAGLFAGILSVILAGFFGFGFLENVFGSPSVYMLGASGAIFGIAGLFVVLLPRMRFGIIFVPFFSLPGFIMIPLVLILMWVASIGAGLPIGNVAHFGGFLVGLSYGFYLRIKYRRKIIMLQRYFR
ncbi:MAG: rhomboid family intramembrane serine protease [Candidatus Pacearchaeota archaeon]